MPRSVTRTRRRRDRPLKEFVRCRVCGRKLRLVHWLHLRVHAMTTEEYRERYRVGFVMCDAARVRISRSFARTPKPDRYVPRSRRTILAELRRHGRARSPLSYEWLRESNPRLVAQASSHFGSWRAALAAAGVQPVHPNVWSDDHVLAEIRRRHDAGEVLSDQRVRRADPSLHGAARTRFGSWRRAVLAAGVDYAVVRERRIRSEADVARELRAWCREHGPLNHTALRDSEPALFRATEWRFGTVTEAARQLGLPIRGKLRRWSRDTLIETITARAARGGSLRCKAVKASDRSLMGAANE